MSTTMDSSAENQHEIATESIKSVTDVFNKGIGGNPLAFISALIVVVLSVILLGVLASNIYFQYQGMEKQMESTIQMQRNNELLSDIVRETQKTNTLLQRFIDVENYKLKK